MTGIVTFENVGLRYGMNSETLSDLSFALPRGSFHFLTGASGAGKSSLLGLITLAQRPSRGRIHLFGEDVADAPRARLPAFGGGSARCTRIFGWSPHLSAYDNVALPLRIAGVAEREIGGPVGEMLDWVGLSERTAARPATLSGGEQQRRRDRPRGDRPARIDHRRRTDRQRRSRAWPALAEPVRGAEPARRGRS